MIFNGVEKTLYYKAVQLLAQRSHSTVELKQKLVIYASKKYDNLDSLSKHIEAVINHCLSHHWLDDQDYINQYIDIRARKGYGKHRIVMELKQKGLDSSLISSLIHQKEIDWVQLAYRQVKKKCNSFKNADTQQKVKIRQFLLYRGFSHGDICDVFTLFR